MSNERRIWKHHSRIKLRLLKRYLYMCTTIYPTGFQYFETHGGEGRILFKDGVEEDGSSLIAANNRNKIKCVIMEYDSENVSKLREILPSDSYPNVIILQGDSNLEIDNILKKIDNYKFSLGFIDPDSPKQLKWETILKISNHSYLRKRDDFLRKPELIINFPIKGIKQNAGFLDNPVPNANSICDINTQFFGSDEWKDIWRKTKNDIKKSKEEFMNLYVKNLKKLYKFVIPLVFVESIANHPLYYIISCSQHDLGNDFLLKVKNDIEQWKNEDWVRQYYKVHSLADFLDDTENIDGKKQSSLFDY
ncbi:MAG: three-Cys-motif partner protein TcmP (plasmid) [Candidatus Methanoperedens sp.]|nr:MAG: three-Cys-motif partner protein TcmP [Candidatus Methanoperedens sp.]